MSSRRPTNGLTKVAPTLAASRACVGEKTSVTFEVAEFDLGGERYLKTGELAPESVLNELSEFDAIYLGAVGFPGVADHESLWGLLIPIRRSFDQYVNLRPVRLFEGVSCPLAGRAAGDIDFWIVEQFLVVAVRFGSSSCIGKPFF